MEWLCRFENDVLISVPERNSFHRVFMYQILRLVWYTNHTPTILFGWFELDMLDVLERTFCWMPQYLGLIRSVIQELPFSHLRYYWIWFWYVNFSRGFLPFPFISISHESFLPYPSPACFDSSIINTPIPRCRFFKFPSSSPPAFSSSVYRSVRIGWWKVTRWTKWDVKLGNVWRSNKPGAPWWFWCCMEWRIKMMMLLLLMISDDGRKSKQNLWIIQEDMCNQITCSSSNMARITETEKLILGMEQNGEISVPKLVPYLRELTPIKMLFPFFDGPSWNTWLGKLCKLWDGFVCNSNGQNCHVWSASDKAESS